MAEVVSLKLHRKRKARAEKEAQAAENRVKFGKTKAERQLEGATKALQARKLDGHKLDK